MQLAAYLVWKGKELDVWKHLSAAVGNEAYESGETDSKQQMCHKTKTMS